MIFLLLFVGGVIILVEDNGKIVNLWLGGLLISIFDGIIFYFFFEILFDLDLDLSFKL